MELLVKRGIEHFIIKYFYFSEPQKLLLEEKETQSIQYNINVVKDVKVTDSYLELDKSVRGCQNEESYEDCTTSYYIKTLLENCKCLPFNIRLHNKV